LAGCALPTLIEPSGHETLPVGASLFVINSSNISIEKVTMWRTIIQGWDPDYQMAMAQRDIEHALVRRGRLSPSLEKAGLVLRIDPPRPESDGVFEEVKVVSRSSGKIIAVVSKKGDSWDEAVQEILNWVDRVPQRHEGGGR
jgi:hypothetical protein